MASAGRDAAAALVSLIGAILLIWVVIPAETIPGDEGELSQAFMPSLAAAVILVTAVVTLFRTSRRGWEPPDHDTGSSGLTPEEMPVDRIFWGVLAGALVIFTVVLFLIDRFGHLPGSMAAILFFGLVFNRRAWIGIAALAIAFPVVVHIAVFHGLGLSLP